MPKKVTRAAEETYRISRNKAANLRFGKPAKGLKVIAVTGTNGKTTTCSFINEMLKGAGFTTAMFTTAEIEINGDKKPNITNRTVVLTAELFNLLRQAKEAKVDYVVLEVTSQALHQHKLRGIPVEVAVMTNLTQEHLDYHKTMEDYAAAKARLFNKYMMPRACALNHDDEWYGYFARESVGEVLSYGRNSESTLRIKNVEASPAGNQIEANYRGENIDFSTKLIGEFNAYNAVAAMAAGLALGLKPDKLTKGITSLQAVPGRMEPVVAGQPYQILIDYAVTPDALKNVLETARSITKGSLHIVFGATGDRDKTKRPEMGRVTAELADKIYLTDDETYTENPKTIRKEVYEGIEQAGGADKAEVIDDREKAVKTALKAAKPGDTVLVTGIGHQTYRNMGGTKLPWSEREVIEKSLKH